MRWAWIAVALCLACSSSGTDQDVTSEARSENEDTGISDSLSSRELAVETVADASTQMDQASDAATLLDLLPEAMAPDQGSDQSSTPDTLQSPDVGPGPEPWFAPLNTDEWLKLLQGDDGQAFGDLIARYDGPVCDGETCVLITFVEGAQEVFIRGEFNDWAPTDSLIPVAHSPGYWFWVLEDYAFDRHAQYKLFANEEWFRDPMNRWVRFADMAVNSAFYKTYGSRLAMVEDLYSPQLDNERNLFVYVPAEAFQQPEKRFPVLYMQDGFNVFANPMAPFGSWDVDVGADQLFEGGDARAAIIVGINTNDRFNEYIYAAITVNIGVPIEVTPKLDEYAEFVAEMVVPNIEEDFPALPESENRGIAGSSLGGISALYIAWHHPDVFGLVGSMSGSYWLGEAGSGTAEADSMRAIVDANPPGPAHMAMRIYMDSGDSGDNLFAYSNDNRDVTDWMRNKLIAVGFDNRPEWDDDGDLSTPPVDFDSVTAPEDVPTLFWSQDVPAEFGSWSEYLQTDRSLLHVVGAGHAHNESAWEARTPLMLRYLFPPLAQ
jgi:enterochelin esterase-like enzyme